MTTAMESRIVSGQEVVEWVAATMNRPILGSVASEVAVGIGVEKDGEIIGGIIYNDWNGANVFIHQAAVKKGRWLSRTFLSVIFHYAFEQLKVKRITAAMSSANVAANRVVTGLGFQLEAVLAGAEPDGDMNVYRMMAQDCRWINKQLLQRSVANGIS